SVLGLREVQFLDYIDGDLDQADPREAVAKIVGHLRRMRPDVVLTFDQNGAYGHPDHIAICQQTTAAIVAAADPGYMLAKGQRPHRVAKLYYMAQPAAALAAYEAAFGDLVMQVDGVGRRPVPWVPWAVTTQLDTERYWEQVWEAVSCH